MTALALAVALLAGGSAGGAVAAFETRSDTSSNAGASAGLSQTEQSAGSSSVIGTPESAAAAIAPSVVTVEVTGSQSTGSQGFFGGPSQSQPVADTGSGVIIRSDGYILTNNHVVAAAEGGGSNGDAAAGSVNVTFSNGKTVSATIVGHDATSDLAVLKVSGVDGLQAATFADSDKLKVGQAVLAVGAPLGLSNTVTEGIVSTLHRPVATGEQGASSQAVLDAVQTDAAINPGNSGGALVDLAGHVVGINSAIASTSDSSSGQAGNIGVGFAIPSNDASKVAEQLITKGHATHAQIGISASDEASTTEGAPGLGATVQTLTAGGPAAEAGLQRGDVITKVGDRVVTDAQSLVVAVRANDPGATVTVTYERGGSTHTTKVTLGSASGD